MTRRYDRERKRRPLDLPGREWRPTFNSYSPRAFAGWWLENARAWRAPEYRTNPESVTYRRLAIAAARQANSDPKRSPLP